LNKFKLEFYLSNRDGDADELDSYVEIKPGAGNVQWSILEKKFIILILGGTEGNDWALMLMNMYLKWGMSSNYECLISNLLNQIKPIEKKNHYTIATIVEKTDGEIAGIKHCLLKISGPKAFGWLKKESGIHRLVRNSPFDSSVIFSSYFQMLI